MTTEKHYMGILDEDTLDRIYSSLVENLRAECEVKFGSIGQAAAAIGVDRSNLSKHINGKNQISVGVFLRLMIALGVLNPQIIHPRLLEQRTGLRDHMGMNQDPVTASILYIEYN